MDYSESYVHPQRNHIGLCQCILIVRSLDIITNLFDFEGSRAYNQDTFSPWTHHSTFYIFLENALFLTKTFDFDKCDKFAFKSQTRSKVKLYRPIVWVIRKSCILLNWFLDVNRDEDMISFFVFIFYSRISNNPDIYRNFLY